MINKLPLISIVITSFNRANWIGRAIQSALDQDYKNLEIIISDNNSTDNTDEVVRSFCSDSRIKYYRNETNIGMIENFKKATYELATGEYITYISSDDYLCNNNFVSHAVALILKYANIILAVSKCSTFSNNNDTLLEDDNSHMFVEEFRLGTDCFQLYPFKIALGWGGVLMNRQKLIDSNALFSKAQSLDIEANLKLMLQGNIAFIKIPCYAFRLHDAQASSTMKNEAFIDNLDYIENTYTFAKTKKLDFDLEEWRREVYIYYVSGIARKMINKKEEFKKLLYNIKHIKKVELNFFKYPKLGILYLIYKNYNNVSWILKLILPKVYQSIENDKLI